MVQEIFASAEGASLLGGLRACSPRKFSNLKALKRHFQHSQADSCVRKVSKIDLYFLLNFDKKSVARCHQLQYIFIIINCCHTPFNIRKIQYKFLTKDQKVHSVVLFSVHLRSLREFTISSIGKNICH